MHFSAGEFFIELSIDCAGSLFIGLSVVNFAQNANFAPGGITGMALLINYLTGLPIGQIILWLNLPISLIVYKYLGKGFFFRSLKTMVISSFFIDYIAPLLPLFTGDRLIASIFSGLLAGLGFALIYLQNSSTGGSDFLIMSVKKIRPALSIGQITSILDGSVILASAFVYHEMGSVFYGLVYTLVCSLTIDKIMHQLIKCHPSSWFHFWVADYRN